MARFRFRLQPVLRQRELAEREVQERLAELERRRLTIEERLRTKQQYIEQEERALHALLSVDRVQPSEARAQNASILRARNEAQQIAVELAGVYKRIEHVRGELVKAAASRRSMELIRESQLETWKQGERKKEDAMLDELGVLRAARMKEGLM